MPLPSHRDYTLGGRVFRGMPSGPSTLPRQPPADDPCAWITRRRRAMDDGEGTLSIALLSGTDDKLSAAALLTAGAAALGRKVDILLQYWALDAFRAGNLTKDHGLAPEAGPDGAAAVRRLQAEGGGQHWSTVLAQAKQLGEVRDARLLAVDGPARAGQGRPRPAGGRRGGCHRLHARRRRPARLHLKRRRSR